MNQIQQAEKVFGVNAQSLTSLDKAILKKLPKDVLVFSLKQEGKKYRAKILLRRHGKAR